MLVIILACQMERPEVGAGGVAPSTPYGPPDAVVSPRTEHLDARELGGTS